MSWGEVTKIDVLFIKDFLGNPTPPDLGGNNFNVCCSTICALADTSDSDPLKNDYYAFAEFFPVTFNVVMTLQKLVSGTWTDQATLVDDTYGTLHDFNPRNNVKCHAYTIEWREVLDAFDSGKYRVNFDYGAAAINSFEFCLDYYSTDLADGTVRATYTRNSVIGSVLQNVTRDFVGTNLASQFRFCDAIFGGRKSTIETESHRLNGGKERTYLKRFKEEYSLTVRNLHYQFHPILLYDIMQADDISFTDYNSINTTGTYVDVEVEVNGNFEPNYRSGNNESSIEIAFVDKWDNRRKMYS